LLFSHGDGEENWLQMRNEEEEELGVLERKNDDAEE
jgi:hypothetical protein